MVLEDLRLLLEHVSPRFYGVRCAWGRCVAVMVAVSPEKRALLRAHTFHRWSFDPGRGRLKHEHLPKEISKRFSRTVRYDRENLAAFGLRAKALG